MLKKQCDGAEKVTTCGDSYRAVAPKRKPIETPYKINFEIKIFSEEQITKKFHFQCIFHTSLDVILKEKLIN